MNSKKRASQKSKRLVSKSRGSASARAKRKKKSGQEAEKLTKLPPHASPQDQNVVRAAVSISESFSGPLPHPGDLAQYEKVLPGAAERIMSMAEKEQEIRKDGQTKMLSNDKKRINAATWIALGIIGAAGLAIWKGFAVTSVFLVGIGMLNTVLRMLLRRPDQKASRDTE